MPNLSIDLARLEALQADMRVVRQEFDGAEEFSQAVADLVGHDGLAGVVRDFVSKWNLRRSELLEELEYLAEAAKTIHDTMIELDTELSGLLPHSYGHSQGAGPSMQASFMQDTVYMAGNSLDEIPSTEAIDLHVNLQGQSQGASTDGDE